MQILKTLLNYVDNDLICHITGKYTGSAHSNSNIDVKLNNKISAVFHNLKHYDSHLILQELGKFNFKTNVMPNRLEK